MGTEKCPKCGAGTVFPRAGGGWRDIVILYTCGTSVNIETGNIITGVQCRLNQTQARVALLEAALAVDLGCTPSKDGYPARENEWIAWDSMVGWEVESHQRVFAWTWHEKMNLAYAIASYEREEADGE